MSDTIKKAQTPDELAKQLAAIMMSICGSISNLELFVKLTTDAIELMDEAEEAVVESTDAPQSKLSYLIGQKSAYRELRNAAQRALKLASGEKPPQDGMKESTAGDAL